MTFKEIMKTLSPIETIKFIAYSTVAIFAAYTLYIAIWCAR